MEISRNTRQFTKEDLAGLSLGDSQNLVYDISRLNPRDFIPIVQAIERYGKNHIFSLTFTLDYYYEYCWSEYPNLKSKGIRKRHRKQLMPFTLANSAYKKIPNTIHQLMTMLGDLLPSTITLNTLKFRSILFNQRDKDRLFSAISGNTSIRKLCFTNCNLNDEGFSLLVKCLKHPGVTTLECRQCGLSDHSVGAVSELLTYHMLLQLKAEKDDDNYLKSVCLRALDLRDNMFSTRLLPAISDTLCDLPICLVDLRNNADFDERILSNMRRSSPHVEIRTGLDKTTFEPNAKKTNDQSIDETKSETENAVEIELSPDVRIKGSRAKEFVNYLEKIIKLSEELAIIQQLEEKGRHESHNSRSPRSARSNRTSPRSPSSPRAPRSRRSSKSQHSSPKVPKSQEATKRKKRAASARRNPR
ncbi:hypothetical protein TRFO_16709 [Tritrichomonas foetus]|uniref:Leucine Rich Repeat family protein n=1 Tax=Tritrichomonas foetus TaxID=1144522 RepID=A0A1J4KUB4_9EUKA|nr:hypothetical protein TRFO_16709 [Tritrichomonas foetus]|eukprot:OHT13254.1 hypothetical protein TRFO_16709 [Tritrichomonas foetus]